MLCVCLLKYLISQNHSSSHERFNRNYRNPAIVTDKPVTHPRLEITVPAGWALNTNNCHTPLCQHMHTQNKQEHQNHNNKNSQIILLSSSLTSKMHPFHIHFSVQNTRKLPTPVLRIDWDCDVAQPNGHILICSERSLSSFISS